MGAAVQAVSPAKGARLRELAEAYSADHPELPPNLRIDLVAIELTDKQPKTLWETLSPEEYPFESNVDPAVPHPRWSQATERQVDTGDRIRTLPLNGYAAQVASLYKK